MDKTTKSTTRNKSPQPSGYVPGQARAQRMRGKDYDPRTEELIQQGFHPVRAQATLAGTATQHVRRSHKPPATATDILATSPAMWVFDIIVTLMVLIALFWFYGSYFTNISSDRQQSAITREINDIWGNSNEPVSTDVDPLVGDPWLASTIGSAQEGDPLMKIYIPRLGDQWEYTVVKGVTNPSLAKGPGMYTSTQLPGQRGNMALAGHRDGNGAPFFDLDDMRTCDAIAVQTRDHWYVYRVLPGDLASGALADPAARESAAMNCMTDSMAKHVAGTAMDGGVIAGKYRDIQGVHITTPEDNSVIFPVPSDKDVVAGQAGIPMMTLTTCHPLYFNYERLIVHAVLERVEPVAEHGGLPEGIGV